MGEEGIRWGTCNTIHQYAKANNKYMKDCGKNKEWSYLKYWDVNDLHDWAMSQKQTSVAENSSKVLIRN